jgi:hypothetical protein
MARGPPVIPQLTWLFLETRVHRHGVLRVMHWHARGTRHLFARAKRPVPQLRHGGLTLHRDVRGAALAA